MISPHRLLISALAFGVSATTLAAGVEPDAARPASHGPRYWLVSEESASGLSQYDFEVFLNGELAKNVKSGEPEVMDEVTRFVTPGINTVTIIARKSLGNGRKSESKDIYQRVYIAKGTLREGGALLLQSPEFDYRRTAAESGNFADQGTFTAQAAAATASPTASAATTPTALATPTALPQASPAATAAAIATPTASHTPATVPPAAAQPAAGLLSPSRAAVLIVSPRAATASDLSHAVGTRLSTESSIQLIAADDVARVLYVEDAPPPAVDPSAKQRADALWSAAHTAYIEADYRAALQALDELAPVVDRLKTPERIRAHELSVAVHLKLEDLPAARREAAAALVAAGKLPGDLDEYPPSVRELFTEAEAGARRVTITLQGAPSGSEISIDDRPLAGNTATVPVGVHRLRVSARGFRVVERDISLMEDQTVSVALVPALSEVTEQLIDAVLATPATPSLEQKQALDRLATRLDVSCLVLISHEQAGMRAALWWAPTGTLQRLRAFEPGNDDNGAVAERLIGALEEHSRLMRERSAAETWNKMAFEVMSGYHLYGGGFLNMNGPAAEIDLLLPVYDAGRFALTVVPSAGTYEGMGSVITPNSPNYTQVKAQFTTFYADLGLRASVQVNPSFILYMEAGNGGAEALATFYTSATTYRSEPIKSFLPYALVGASYRPGAHLELFAQGKFAQIDSNGSGTFPNNGDNTGLQGPYELGGSLFFGGVGYHF